jgi:F0F1-type ATP synthase assembly protein I
VNESGFIFGILVDVNGKVLGNFNDIFLMFMPWFWISFMRVFLGKVQVNFYGIKI